MKTRTLRKTGGTRRRLPVRAPRRALEPLDDRLRVPPHNARRDGRVELGLVPDEMLERGHAALPEGGEEVLPLRDGDAE